ncbi:methionyl-tRNA formyltransferase-like isoform X1 [Senna tora]|uniref:methionyl-tRNA formyltransferase n=1 Tax=Senna tora TaxID=362788 RepID=A0A834WK56_9FABA|nr:methionyl-tRNA formyltransferase-like isoform X1 [Senna tora]
MIRRFCCLQSATSPPSLGGLSSKKKSLVLLGSPQVSATVLDALLNASASPDSSFEVAAIVTQPSARRDRGKKVLPSPLAKYALDRGFSSDLIFTPERAGEEAFLSNLKALQPELCITAAYGNILPSKFLNIPPLGTVNIHPSLLPLYRGAAPVQRALQDGVKETGVSLAFTVRELDAGPIIASEKVDIDEQIKGPDLLSVLFLEGSKLLVRELPSIFDGSARLKAHPQDHTKATLAPKISPEESWLSFDQEALVLHNKVSFLILFELCRTQHWRNAKRASNLLDSRNHSWKSMYIIILISWISLSIDSSDSHRATILFKSSKLLIMVGNKCCKVVLNFRLKTSRALDKTTPWSERVSSKLFYILRFD